MVSTASAAAPAARSASVAPASRRSVTKSLNRDTTIAIRKPVASVLPWKCMMLAAPELRRALLQERPRALFHVLGGEGQAEQRRFDETAFGERRLEAVR